MKKQCQSCGMPLETKKAGDCRGSEKDGTKSEKWCAMCYENGKFINPNCTLNEMKIIVDNALRQEHWISPLRWMAEARLLRLERWKQQTK